MICNLCPRLCNIDRSFRKGVCLSGDIMKVAAIVLHRGEEPPLVKGRGSGAIFFSGCPMRCQYCQNMDISHQAWGQEIKPEELACYMARLESLGASNINLVTPTHFTPWVLDSIMLARQMGVRLPVMVNSGGYELTATMRMWYDYASIYLMDLKYGDNNTASILSKVPDYWDKARDTIIDIYENMGPLVVDEKGMARKGLMVRHLVLPGMISNPFSVLEFLASVARDIPISIMSQYNPNFYTGNVNELKRTITQDEYRVVVEKAIELGFETIFVQDASSSEVYSPDFKSLRPFGDTPNLLSDHIKDTSMYV